MITLQKFQELIKKGYSLDTVFLLQNLDKIDCIDFNNPKLAILKQGLIRRGLISEEGRITVDGNELLQFISSPSEEKLVRKPKNDEPFDLFWKSFPGLDSFSYKGRSFSGSRALRVKKEDCKTKIKAILNEGEYTIDDIIGALKLEVEQKMESSLKTGQNKLSYLQNSLTWLNQRGFENYVELFRKQGLK